MTWFPGNDLIWVRSYDDSIVQVTYNFYENHTDTHKLLTENEWKRFKNIPFRRSVCQKIWTS